MDNSHVFQSILQIGIIVNLKSCQGMQWWIKVVLYVMNIRNYNQGYYECVGETKENEDFYAEVSLKVLG